MEQKIAVGLDIVTTKITVMIGRKTEHGKIEILGMGKAPSAGVMRVLLPISKRPLNLLNRHLMKQFQNLALMSNK